MAEYDDSGYLVFIKTTDGSYRYDTNLNSFENLILVKQLINTVIAKANS